MLQPHAKENKNEPNETTTTTFTRQGSLRRVLPSGHNKENLFGRQNEDLNKFYRMFHQEYVILAEYKMILSENVKGVYVIPSRESPLVWFGVLFGRHGYYEDGVFRFNLVLDDAFPEGKHPRVVFQSEVYHPVVEESSGELNLLGGFPTWTKGEQHLWQVLKYVHWAFHNVTSCLPHAVNAEAADLLRTNDEAFKERTKRCVQLSRERLFERPPTDDRHYITFERYIPGIHDAVRLNMLRSNDERSRPVTPGHSWVKEGTFRPLTRDPSVLSESHES